MLITIFQGYNSVDPVSERSTSLQKKIVQATMEKTKMAALPLRWRSVIYSWRRRNAMMEALRSTFLRRRLVQDRWLWLFQDQKWLWFFQDQWRWLMLKQWGAARLRLGIFLGQLSEGVVVNYRQFFGSRLNLSNFVWMIDSTSWQYG